jgi:hypothetical protein
MGAFLFCLLEKENNNKKSLLLGEALFGNRYARNPFVGRLLRNQEI